MKKNIHNYKNQAGLVLVLVLILVPIILMVSYTSINKLTVGERSTTNVVDRSHAFYAAETAIAAAESWMKSGQDPFASSFKRYAFRATDAQFDGLFDVDITIDNALGDNDDNRDVVPYNKYLPPGSGQEGILARLPPPVFIIQLVDMPECVEPMEKTRALFKVTARGWGLQQSTRVTLENFFTMKFDCNNIQNQTDG